MDLTTRIRFEMYCRSLSTKEANWFSWKEASWFTQASIGRVQHTRSTSQQVFWFGKKKDIDKVKELKMELPTRKKKGIKTNSLETAVSTLPLETHRKNHIKNDWEIDQRELATASHPPARKSLISAGLLRATDLSTVSPVTLLHSFWEIKALSSFPGSYATFNHV